MFGINRIANILLMLLVLVLPSVILADVSNAKLIVMVQADVDYNAGMVGETRSSYAEKIGRQLVSDIKDEFGDLIVSYQPVKNLRRNIKSGREKYAALCEQYKANYLYLGDVVLINSPTDEDDTYWPHLDLHLYNCKKQKGDKYSKDYIPPKYNDEFPYQQSIAALSSNFLSVNKKLVSLARIETKKIQQNTSAGESAVILQTQQNASNTSMIVLAQADVDYSAGMVGETKPGYAEKIGKQLVRDVNNEFADLAVSYRAVKNLRRNIKSGREKYAALCEQFKANYLYLGDVVLINSPTDEDDTYWPHLDLHLYNCQNQRVGKFSKNYIPPKYNDEFAYQQSITEFSRKFLSNFRSVIRAD